MSIFNTIAQIADFRIGYGRTRRDGESVGTDRRLSEEQGGGFGDLRLPKMKAGQLAPLVVFLHGGWWQSDYDLEYGGHLCEALRAFGIATWSLEYRRVGRTGGGWPMTFQDVADGFDFVGELARKYPVDLKRVFVMGHSAGGHLAFWLAGWQHIPAGDVLHEPQPKIGIRGVIGLAAVVDLRLTIDLSGWLTFAHDKREVYSLMGGTPAQFPERYRAGDPGFLLPLNARQLLIQGANDSQIPGELPVRWADQVRRLGEEVKVTIVPGADHFDVVDPGSRAWPAVQAAITAIVLG